MTVERPPLLKTAVLGAVTIITLVGAVLRLQGLSARGISFHDEAVYLRDGQFVLGQAQILPQAWPLLMGNPGTGASSTKAELRRLWESVSGAPSPHLHPLHGWLIAAAMALIGPRDFAGLLVSAVFGTATIPLLYFLAARLFGVATGLLAAAALAVMPYHVAYSREALAEADSVFFFVAAIAAYAMVRIADTGTVAARVWPLLAITGTFSGLSFVSNGRWVLIPVLIGLLEAHYWLTTASLRRSTQVGRLAWLFGGMALPIVVMELPFRVVGLASSSLGLNNSPVPTFLEILVGRIYQFGVAPSLAEPGLRLANLVTYPFLIWNLWTPLATIALVAGTAISLAAAARTWQFAPVLMCAWLLVPLLFFMAAFGTDNQNCARFLTLAVPSMAVLTARGLIGPVERWLCDRPVQTIASLSKRGLFVLVMVVSTVLVSGLSESVQLLELQSGWPRLLQEAGANGIRRYVSNESEIVRFYGGEVLSQTAFAAGADPEALVSTAIVIENPGDQSVRGPAGGRLLLSVPHPMAGTLQQIFEQYGDFWPRHQRWREAASGSRARTLDVWTLALGGEAR